MAKRGATSDLNHENWDREEEPEEAGTYSKASEDVLKQRVIKVARRRNPMASTQSGNGDEGDKPKAFGGFTGFSKPPISSASSTNFNFLSNLSPKTDQSDVKKTNGNAATSPKDTMNDEYFSKLKGLNESVVEWIRAHVSKNPLINLQPIFRDYDKYFADLEKLKTSKAEDKTETEKTGFSFAPEPAKTTSSTEMTTASSTTTTSAPKFSFGASPPKFSFGASNTTTSSFSFGAPSKGTSSASTITLGSSASGESPKPLFSFGNTQSGFTFKPTQALETSEEKPEEVDEDAPPKVEFKTVVEEGHIYTIRCKVFVKKDGSFGDRGVGNLYLKPVPDSEKIQLIVRADTNLGNLLCNFILSEGIPIQRMGKKDVMLVCLPTPDTKPPPVPILLRVKSTEDADDLFKTLEEHKK